MANAMAFLLDLISLKSRLENSSCLEYTVATLELAAFVRQWRSKRWILLIPLVVRNSNRYKKINNANSRLSMPDQMPFSIVPFIENAEQRCPCILVLDVSGSMQGAAIRELNEGIVQFKDEVHADQLAVKRLDLAIISFGEEVSVITPFTGLDTFQPPVLSAGGSTPMGAAINRALDLLAERKISYRQYAIQHYRPWIFLITDGGPTDSWQSAAKRVHEEESQKRCSFFAVGVDGANFDILKQICVREPLKLKGMRFRDLFIWLSSSLKAVSASKVGDAVPLINPVTPSGWAEA